MADTIEIGGRVVGPGHPVLVTGEVAQAHDGSLGTAHAYIDAIADAGADAVKFQAHIAAEESTPGEPWRVRFSRQDATRYDYWKRMEFAEPHWRDLAEHARDRGLVFLASPFSVAAVGMLGRVGVPAWKIGAGEVATPDLMEAVLGTGKPVLLSSGMSPWAELDAAVGRIRARGVPFAVYQCTTAYPCPPERIGLNVLADLRARYGCPVGLSDHSGTIFPGLAACALGASLLEVHVTFSRQAFGPDVPASLTVDELRTLVDGARFLGRARASPVDKDAEAEALAEMRTVFRKRAVARTDLPAGHRLGAGDVAFKKAGTGMPADRAGTLAGRVLRRAVRADEGIEEGDVE
jgi:N-acetylneuraminate synthase